MSHEAEARVKHFLDHDWPRFTKHFHETNERIMSVLSDLQASVAALQTAGTVSTSAVLAAIADIQSLPASDAALVPLTTAITGIAAQMQKDAAALLAAVGTGTGVTPVAPSVTSFGVDVASGAAGSPRVLTAVVTGTPAPLLSVDNGVTLAADGTATVNPTVTTVYNLSASNSAGSASAAVTVTVV